MTRRSRISARAAVHVVEKIADELLEYGSSSLVCWGDADNGVYAMLSEIRRLKKDSEQLYQLKNVLQGIIK